MIIDKKFRKLRIQMRHSSKKIIDEAIKERLYFEIEDKKSKKEICIFCSSADTFTKEHVVPKGYMRIVRKNNLLHPEMEIHKPIARLQYQHVQYAIMIY